MFLDFFKNRGRSNNVANENLIEIKTIGETLARASLMIANVAPQIKVIIRSTDSAEYFFIRIMFFYSLFLI
jgi:hypothetical protein